MRTIKNKHRRRTHLLVNVVLRTSWFQYTGRQMGPNKTETMCCSTTTAEAESAATMTGKMTAPSSSGSTAGITQLLIRGAYTWRESA